MSDSWRRVTIGELIDSGIILAHKDGNYGSFYPRADEFGSEGVPFLTAKSLSSGYVDIDGAPRLSFARASQLPFGFVEEDDILLSHNATVGRVAIVPDFAGQLLVGTSLTYFRVDSRSLLPRYLAVFFQGVDFQNQLSAVMSHSTRNQVPVTAQRKLEIVLPPMLEQSAIAHILGTLDDKIELNRKQNETLEAMARALFNDCFVDFGPVRAKMEGRAPYLPSEIWELFPDQLDEEGKPEGWQLEPLTQVLTIVSGGTPKTSIDEYWGGEVPWFSVVDTPQPSEVFVIATEKTITPEGLAGSSARLIPKGATIISARGTVGNLAIAGREMTFNQSCYGLRGTGSAGDFFIYLTAQQMVDQLKSMAHGSVFSTITRQTIEAVHRPVPTPGVLRSFEGLVTGWFDSILLNVEESRILSQLRDTLLPKLISGELRIKDLARMGVAHD